jgi:hypothetical protein
MVRGILPMLVIAMMQLLFLGRQVSANVIGIDFASDSVKVAIVQPGTPSRSVGGDSEGSSSTTAIFLFRNDWKQNTTYLRCSAIR